MKIVIALLIACLLALLTGCSSTMHIIPPQVTLINHPTIGDEHSSELGETLIIKGRSYTYEGFKLENTVTAGGSFLKQLTLKAGTLLRFSMFDENRLYYTTDKLEIYDPGISTKMAFGGLSISNSDYKYIIFYSGFLIDLVPDPTPILTKAKVIDFEKPYFRQELIYNGRSADTIKFLYREYSGDYLRSPFAQDIQYDLNEGNTIGFKGARLEIIDATNIKIRYRVLNSFPDPISQASPF